jgi:hypothetical protein
MLPRMDERGIIPIDPNLYCPRFSVGHYDSKYVTRLD